MNEIVLNTTTTLDFKPIVLAGEQAPAAPLATAQTQATAAPTLAPAEQRAPALPFDWNLVIAVLVILAVLILAARFLAKPRRAERAFETLPRERAYEREHEVKHAHKPEARHEVKRHARKRTRAKR
jgi:heme/copper-type cytochrome/quinol oxidase subunit 2